MTVKARDHDHHSNVQCASLGALCTVYCDIVLCTVYCDVAVLDERITTHLDGVNDDFLLVLDEAVLPVVPVVLVPLLLLL